MKPRLEVVPLTPLDSAIMHGIRARWRYPLNRWYQYYDRCDADLMLEAQRIAICGPCSIELHGIACRGWDQAENGKLRGSL